jgi:hypothetical protein
MIFEGLLSARNPSLYDAGFNRLDPWMYSGYDLTLILQ